MILISSYHKGSFHLNIEDMLRFRQVINNIVDMSEDGEKIRPPVKPNTSKTSVQEEIARLNQEEKNRKEAEAKLDRERQEKRQQALEKRDRKEQEQKAARDQEARERRELEGAKRVDPVVGKKGASEGPDISKTTSFDGPSAAALEAQSLIEKGTVNQVVSKLETILSAQFERKKAWQAAATVKPHLIQTPLPPAKQFEKPCRPVEQLSSDEEDLLQKLLTQIGKHPEAQTLSEVAKRDVAEKNTKVLSENTNLVAKSMGGLEEVPIKAPLQGDRKTYDIEVDREGPVYMPRKKDDGKNFRQNGEPVYDMLYYVKRDDKFLVDYSKSFIAADGIPAGSLSSVTKDTRENCWKHHEKKFEKEKSITPADSLGPDHAQAQAQKMVAGLAHIPPAPPPPHEVGDSIGGKQKPASLLEEIKSAQGKPQRPSIR